MDTAPKGDASRNDDGEWIYTRRFWHHLAKRFVYAKPGKVIRFRRRRRRR